jgi:hypothetical protein
VRFAALARALPFARAVFEEQPALDLLLGTARLANAPVQPASPQLAWWEGHLVVRCVSPIGRVEGSLEALGRSFASPPASVGIVQVAGGSYNAMVEENVLLGEPQHDAGRVAALIRRVARQADDLEYEYLLGADRSLPDFRDDLAKDRAPCALSGGSSWPEPTTSRSTAWAVRSRCPSSTAGGTCESPRTTKGYELEAVVAEPGETAQLHDACMTAWQRNRGSRVVGYRVDAGGRFCAHA